MQQARPEPVGLRAVPGEATGSFVRRLALVNDLSVAAVLREVADGRVEEWADPRAHEIFLSDLGVERLAVMAWRAPEELRRTLPTLAVKGRGRRPARVAPWPQQWTVLEPCTGCLARCDDIVAPVWWASGEPWQVCVRHGQWLRDARTGGPAQVSLVGLEEVVRAHRRWLRMRHRVGPYARALLADALQVTAWWWQGRLMGSETVWARREEVLGSGRQEWSVPLVVYPEAVVVAEAMAAYERQRRWGREFAGGAPGWVSRHWITFVGERLGMSGPLEHGGYRALREWTLLHRVDTPVAARLMCTAPPPDYLSQQLPVLEPHVAGLEYGPLEDASCMPWRLGRPVSALE
ncbi:TniQ family protein [Streptomyces sp. NPDC058385]|uniref:TniQ family protein n=1 Tax=Streptomyces sp. NPDC058385 TaxID=3346473 RepID=UPI0036601EDC